MRRTLLVAAVGLGAALMVATGIAFFLGFGTTVGANVLVNLPEPIDANNSPTVVRNPSRPSNLVVVHRVDRPEFSARLETSDDGGATWQSRSLPLPDGADRPFAPDAAFARDGTLFVLYANLEGIANTPANLWVSSSSNGGRTLGPPTRVAGALAFQARLAVGPLGQLYVTWLQAADVGLFRLGAGPNPIVAARSDDGGRTFSSPVQVSDPARERVGAASPVVDAGGRLVVLYEDFRSDRRDFENLEGPPADEPFALVVTVSPDEGRTFPAGVEAEPAVVPSRRFVVFLPIFPSLAAGPDGMLYVAWSDGRNGDDDVFIRRSADGGATWSAPDRVNDNRRGDGTSQYLARVAVSPGGRVDVVSLDRRRDRANVLTDAWLASSIDGGRSFRNTRLSSRAFDSRIGLGTPHGDSDLGSHLGVDSAGQDTVAAWADSRAGTLTTRRQDIVLVGVRRLPRWPLLVWPLLAATAAMTTVATRGRRRSTGRRA